MPTKEDVLEQETHKGDVEEVGCRVFYTLTGKAEFQAHRTAKAVSLLIEHLHQKGLLDDEELDELLLNCVG
jgi:hypothetical protein